MHVASWKEDSSARVCLTKFKKFTVSLEKDITEIFIPTNNVTSITAC